MSRGTSDKLAPNELLAKTISLKKRRRSTTAKSSLKHVARRFVTRLFMLVEIFIPCRRTIQGFMLIYRTSLQRLFHIELPLVDPF